MKDAMDVCIWLTGMYAGYEVTEEWLQSIYLPAVRQVEEKLKAAEELDRVVAKYEDESAVWQDVLDVQINYRAAGESNENE